MSEPRVTGSLTPYEVTLLSTPVSIHRGQLGVASCADARRTGGRGRGPVARL